MVDVLHIGLCRLLDEHLLAQERGRRAVSLLASGAAFEAWLAFEMRLLAENNRGQLELDDVISHNGARVPRYFICNEQMKVDFSVIDAVDSAVELAIEFKLIHNNKNWKHQADAVWNDLFPTRESKASTLPRRGRFALVGVVGLVYEDPKEWSYAGQIGDIEKWLHDLDDYLLPANGFADRIVERPWAGTKLAVLDPYLRPGAGSFFQLQMLVGR